MYNLYSFKIKELLFGPIRSTSVHFGLLQSTVVPLGPLRFTSVHCGPIQSNLVHWGNFFSPDALFRPRAYKNRASGQKKFPNGSRDSKTLDPLGNFFFPQMLCLGWEPTKTEQLGKTFPQWTKLDWMGPKWTEVNQSGPK